MQKHCFKHWNQFSWCWICSLNKKQTQKSILGTHRLIFTVLEEIWSGMHACSSGTFSGTFSGTHSGSAPALSGEQGPLVGLCPAQDPQEVQMFRGLDGACVCVWNTDSLSAPVGPTVAAQCPKPLLSVQTCDTASGRVRARRELWIFRHAGLLVQTSLAGIVNTFHELDLFGTHHFFANSSPSQTPPWAENCKLWTWNLHDWQVNAPQAQKCTPTRRHQAKNQKIHKQSMTHLLVCVSLHFWIKHMVGFATKEDHEPHEINACKSQICWFPWNLFLASWEVVGHCRNEGGKSSDAKWTSKITQWFLNHCPETQSSNSSVTRFQVLKDAMWMSVLENHFDLTPLPHQLHCESTLLALKQKQRHSFHLWKMKVNDKLLRPIAQGEQGWNVWDKSPVFGSKMVTSKLGFSITWPWWVSPTCAVFVETPTEGGLCVWNEWLNQMDLKSQMHFEIPWVELTAQGFARLDEPMLQVRIWDLAPVIAVIVCIVTHPWRNAEKMPKPRFVPLHLD